MGALSALLLTGVTEAVTVPDWPGVRESVAGETVIVKPGVEVTAAAVAAASEAELKVGCVAVIGGGEGVIARGESENEGRPGPWR
jgi:hypothetical protein